MNLPFVWYMFCSNWFSHPNCTDQFLMSEKRKIWIFFLGHLKKKPLSYDNAWLVNKVFNVEYRLLSVPAILSWKLVLYINAQMPWRSQKLIKSFKFEFIPSARNAKWETLFQPTMWLLYIFINSNASVRYWSKFELKL